jgi:type IV pilus assembly protein PilC
MNEEQETKDVAAENTEQAETPEFSEEEFGAESLSRGSIKLKSIGLNAVTLFCRQLSTLVDVGIPLLKCLQILHQRTSHPKLQSIIQKLSEEIEQGTAFSAALEKFPNVFSPFFVNMTKVAEKGGSLDEALKEVADVLEKEETMKQKVKEALMYPLITLLVGVVVVFILIVGIIPMFENLYARGDISLPLVTKILLALGRPATLAVILLLLVGVGAFMYVYGQSHGSKAFYDRTKLKLPIFGQFFMKVAVARFARSFGTLIRGGVPMLQALDVVKETSENTVIAEAVGKTIQHVEGGGRLEQPLREADVFPDVVVDMVATGEEAGKLELMLFKVAELYDGEIDRGITTMATSLQPILIVVLGILTAFIAAAMFLPYFQMANLEIGLGL